MDTRYTMRLAAPLGDEEIPAFAERLADIIKGDPARLESLLARGTKGLIRATTKEEADKVATVFRRAGLDVEVVTREEAAAGAAPARASAPPQEAAPVARPAETPVAVESPPEPEIVAAPAEAAPVPEEPALDAPVAVAAPVAPEPTLDDSAATEEVAAVEAFDPVDDTPLIDEPDLAEETHLADAPHPVDDDPHPVADDHLAAEPADGEPTSVTAPPLIAGDPAPYDYDYGRPAGPSAAARLIGLLGALLVVVAPFLGAPAEGITFDFADLGANPYALGMVVLGLVSLLPVLLGRIRWLSLAAVLTAALWALALVDSGRSSDLAGLLDVWAWLLVPGGALLMLIAALLPRPR